MEIKKNHIVAFEIKRRISMIYTVDQFSRTEYDHYF